MEFDVQKALVTFFACTAIASVFVAGVLLSIWDEQRPRRPGFARAGLALVVVAIISTALMVGLIPR